ncbi:MAG: 3-hydroxy-3-methylglutaryl-CoA reductase, partial [Pseudomonadota bacterium]
MAHDQISSRIEGMRSLTPAHRLKAVAEATGLNGDDQRLLAGESALPLQTGDGMIENVVGKFELPLGVATNFTVNGKDYLVPMAVEEPSVVAAASYMARIARGCGGFYASSTAPIMRAQIQVLGLKDPDSARLRLLENAADLIEKANSKDKVLVGLGGGGKDVEVHLFDDTPIGPMLVLHLLVDVRDA